MTHLSSGAPSRGGLRLSLDEAERTIEEGIRRGIESAARGRELTDWLMAVGGAGACLATLALIVLAVQQMRHIREQRRRRRQAG